MRVLGIILHHASNSDMITYLPPEITVALAEMVAAFDRNTGIIILSIFNDILPRMPQVGEILAGIGFDEMMEDINDQEDYIELDVRMQEMIAHVKNRNQEDPNDSV